MRITLSGTSALQRYVEELKKLAASAPAVLADALNEAGAQARKETIIVEAAQTGLSTRILTRAQRERRATPSRLVYEIEAEGGNVSLKYFGARETAKGIVARPWGVSQLYEGAFIKGGRFPNRVDVPKLNGQVFKRAGKSRLPIEKQRSGLYIPEEMTKGATRKAFEAYANAAAGIIVRRLGTMLPS